MPVTKAQLQEDEWVLVWGIGGGVSTATLAIAKALGGRVIVTSSSADKLERARELGADATFNHETDDVVAGVKEAHRRRRARRRRHVGEATWKRSLDAARAEGRVCVCGATTGPNPPANLHRIWWKQLTIFGSTMGSQEDFEAVYELVSQAGPRPSSTRSSRSQKPPRHTSGSRPANNSARSSCAFRLAGVRLADAEDELGVVGHALRRPGRIPGELDLDVLDPGTLATRGCPPESSGLPGQPIDVRLWITFIRWTFISAS